jgi:hypothetical protein
LINFNYHCKLTIYCCQTIILFVNQLLESSIMPVISISLLVNLFCSRAILFVLISTMLSACMGIPLSSIPRLMSLKDELLILTPSDLRIAFQIEESLVPKAGATPTLDLAFVPDKGSDLPAIERKLPMQLLVLANPEGLSSAPSSRRWLIYSLTTESQIELRRQQAQYRKILAEQQSGPKKPGGVLTLGISQAGLAPDDTRLDGTVWQSWLRTTPQAGYFKLWSGTIADLKAAAQKKTP